MTLISILIGLALEYFLGVLDRFRDFSWFDQYSDWLEEKCSGYSFWDGVGGVLLTLAIPLCLLIFLAHVLGEMTVLFSFLLATAVFIYSLGPELNNLIDCYLDALEDNDETEVEQSERELLCDGNASEEEILQSILLRAHDSVFGVIFWFIVLGMYGGLLFCLVARMQQRFSDVHGDYADSVVNLYRILMWPSARLMALGFALSGSLVDALDGWRDAQGDSLDVSEDVIGHSGLSALQYASTSDGDYEEPNAGRIEWVKQIQGLINRTLIVWLTVLGILTIGGWLS